MGLRTFTLTAAPPGSMLFGQLVDWDSLPPDAQAWVDMQVDNGNEIVTVLEGDHGADLEDSFEVYVGEMS